MNKTAAAFAVLASLVIMGEANAQMGAESMRARTWELGIQPRYQFSDNSEYGGGTKVHIEDDWAWGFAVNYNVTEKLAFGSEFGWNFINYDADIVIASPPGLAGVNRWQGSGDTGSWMFNATYTLMHKTLSPFVIGGVGWGWFDSNIATGDVSGVCWWDPWYGYICNAYPETYGSDAFVYRGGAGLRFDATQGFYMKVLYNAQWNDFGNNSNVPVFSQIRMEFGSMFR